MTPRIAAFFLAAASLLQAAPRVDNVLEKMVPPGANSLMGARMDQLKSTALYQRMMAQAKLGDFERFTDETGFDPRRDVREILFVYLPKGAVLLARGSFRVTPAATKKAKLLRHGQYNIWTSEDSGFCILDSTLAAAGSTNSIIAALDEWTSGSHKAAQPLLARAQEVSATAQVWGVSTGAPTFLGEHMPKAGNGLDFGKIFAGLEDAWFEADFSAGLKASVHGTTANERDAVSLRDAARGLVGFGRLSVPEDQPELLKLWDGIVTEQQGRAVTIRADVPQNLVDKVAAMLSAPGDGQGRGINRRFIPKQR